MADLLKELDAKAWQATRRGKRREDHVCYRAAREIERLRVFSDAGAAEKGWRSFWRGFSEYLKLDHEQRTYGCHELMNACSHGIKVVAADAALPPQREES